MAELSSSHQLEQLFAPLPQDNINKQLQNEFQIGRVLQVFTPETFEILAQSNQYITIHLPQPFSPEEQLYLTFATAAEYLSNRIEHERSIQRTRRIFSIKALDYLAIHWARKREMDTAELDALAKNLALSVSSHPQQIDKDGE